MQVEPYLLERWMAELGARQIRYNLSGSYGPPWTLEELLDLAGQDRRQEILEMELLYSHAEGREELRAAIAAMQGVAPEQVQIVTGASEALLILFLMASGPQANVVVSFPSFPPYTAVPRLLNLEVRSYSLRRENGFQLDPDEVKGLVDSNTRLLILNSPHNPTGSTISFDAIRSLHDFAAQRGIPFVVDEVYHPIYHGPPTPSADSLPHAIILGDLSKSLCLSGLRVGWIIERDPRRLQQYFDARSYFTISNSPLAEALAAVAVENRETIFARGRRIAAANLQLLDTFFSEHANLLNWVRPRGGFTAFPWLTNGEDARSFCRALAREGISLVPGDCFGLPEHFRLGFGASGERFPQALEKLASFVGHYAKTP